MENKSDRYETAAREIINDLRGKFGLATVEGKQDVPGLLSGTTWELDGKGIAEGGAGFLIIECRRYTTSRIKQEDMGAVAYRISDTGADGAIVVSPLPVQEGAAKIALAHNIQTVQLSKDASRFSYLVQFLKNIVAAFEDTVSMTDSLEITLTRASDGGVLPKKVIDEDGTEHDA